MIREEIVGQTTMQVQQYRVASVSSLDEHALLHTVDLDADFLYDAVNSVRALIVDERPWYSWTRDDQDAGDDEGNEQQYSCDDHDAFWWSLRTMRDGSAAENDCETSSDVTHMRMVIRSRRILAVSASQPSSTPASHDDIRTSLVLSLVAALSWIAGLRILAAPRTATSRNTLLARLICA